MFLLELTDPVKFIPHLKIEMGGTQFGGYRLGKPPTLVAKRTLGVYDFYF